tara:strand:+ start:186 stop:521 length:336 start_codon:yes stop_codon:yes gene_type:complete
VQIDTITEVIVTAQTGGKAGANQVDYSWIPGKILEAFCYADNVDAEMRSRIVQIVDDVLLPKSLSTTARATGLVVIVAAIGQDSNAYKVSVKDEHTLDETREMATATHIHY